MKYFVLRSIDLYSTCNRNVPDHFTIGEIVEGEITDRAFVCKKGDCYKTYPISKKELDTIFSLVVDDPVEKLSNKIPSMELRDLFAMNVLNGLITGKSFFSITDVVETAYNIADSMLKEREK